MKTTVRNGTLLAGALVLAGVLVWAVMPTGTGKDDEAGTRNGLSTAELGALEGFLAMSDEELDRVQDAIARIRVMSEDERRALAAEIVDYRRLPREERSRIRDGWGRRTGDEEREDWQRMMRELTPTERREIHDRLQAVDRDERHTLRMDILEEWRRGR